MEGRPIKQITSPVAMEMYLGTIIPPLRKSIKNSLFWNSKHAPRTVGEAMAKAQQLYVKHLYALGEEQEEDPPKPVEDVVINEISRKFENKYSGRRDDFHDSSSNRRDNYDQDQRRWQSYNGSRNFGNNSPKYYQQQVTTGPDQQDLQSRFDSMTNQQDSMSDQASSQRQNAERHTAVNNRIDDATCRQSRGDGNQSSVLRGGYTQIMVNLMQLSDPEFTHWMEKLVEARKN